MNTFRTTFFALAASALAGFSSAQSTTVAYDLGNGNIRGRCWMNGAVTANLGSSFDSRTYARVGSSERRVVRVDGLFRAPFLRNRVRGEFGGNILFEYDTTSSGPVSSGYLVYNAFSLFRTYTVDGMSIRVRTEFQGTGQWSINVGLGSSSHTDVNGYARTGGDDRSASATNLSLAGLPVNLSSMLTLPSNRMQLDLHTRSTSAWGTVGIEEYSISMVQRIARAFGWYTVVSANRNHASITRSL